MSDSHCLVFHRIWGSCPECRVGFPQYCRGRNSARRASRKTSSKTSRKASGKASRKR